MAGPDPKRLHLRIARAGRPCVFDVGERGALRNMIPFLARPETDPGSFALPVSQPCDMGGRVVVPLGPLKGPKPRPNQTHNVVSFAGGCTLQTGSASQKKPCSHWLRCHAALGSGPLVSALRRLRFLWPPSRPSLARPPSSMRRGPRDDGMDGRDIGQGCQARNAD